MATTFIAEPRTTDAVPTTYRAAVVHEFGSPLSIEQVAMPTLKPGQVRVKVEACGLCHTDIHAAHGDGRSRPRHHSCPGTKASASSVEIGLA